MNPANTLFENHRIPRKVEMDGNPRDLQVNANAARGRRQKEATSRGRLTKTTNHRNPFLHRHVSRDAVHLETAISSTGFQFIHRIDSLTENNHGFGTVVSEGK